MNADNFKSKSGTNILVFYRRLSASDCYSLAEQFGTGRDFDDLAECVVATLRLQADHEKDRAGATSGKTGADLGVK